VGPAADHGRPRYLVTLRAPLVSNPIDREANSQLSPMPHRSVDGSSSLSPLPAFVVLSVLASGPASVRCIYKYHAATPTAASASAYARVPHRAEGEPALPIQPAVASALNGTASTPRPIICVLGFDRWVRACVRVCEVRFPWRPVVVVNRRRVLGLGLWVRCCSRCEILPSAQKTIFGARACMHEPFEWFIFHREICG
jgi:hypothetical protein